MEEIKAVVTIAQADDFIENTENKHETMIAARRMSLSDGQKQRTSISRTILKSPEILIFDDSTSVLDLKTEVNLYSVLERKCPKGQK